MPICETCGNEYDDVLEITKGGTTHIFDSFECAIQNLAPRCEHCGTRIIGHGRESDGAYYCCDHCVREAAA